MRLPPESPFNLAVFRITVCGLLLASHEWREASQWCAFPVPLRVPPEGLAWALRVVPITSGLAGAMEVVLVGSAVLGLFGFFARTSMALATLSALYLFALPQLTGSVLHDMHLLWFATILAASPCGDVLSIDAWRARRRGSALPSAPSVAYALPLTYARVALGLVYFFPGVWKLATSGWSWVASDNLRNQMYWKWFENGFVPVLRVDKSEMLCHLAALAVVAFELSFLPLALARRTRIFAACAGIAFHLSAQAFLRIPFFGLWGCYVILFDWEWIREGARAPSERVRPAGQVRGSVLGLALLAAIVVQGARGAVQAWPFGCYPTFARVVGTEIPDVVMTATLEDGRPVRLPSPPKSQAAWAVAWSVVRARPSEAAMRAYWTFAARDPFVAGAAKGARAVRFARAWFSVLPENWSAPPLREEPLGAITLP